MAKLNSIALITKYSTKAWDEVYKMEARSSVLDGKEGVNVQWTGAKTVKIAKFGLSGLQNYSRNNSHDTALAGNTVGYQDGSVDVSWEEFTVKMDRAAKWKIELFDNEETDGLTLAAATKEASRTRIIPEIDAYTFSTLAGYCSDDLGNLIEIAATKANALEELNKALLYFDENEVPAEDQVIFLSPKYMNYLRNDTTELARYLMQADYNKDVHFTLTQYEGRTLVVVPPQRFRTAFTTVTSTGSGYAFGYYDSEKSEAVESKEIAFIVCAKSAVMHVVKYNKVKILSGDLALAASNMDGYVVYARVYHDVFVTDNKRYAVYTALNGGSDKTDLVAATSSTPAAEIDTSKNSKVK